MINIKRYKRFLILWIANSAILLASTLVFPTHFALGNNLFTPLQAAVFTGFIWSWVIWQIEPTFKDLEIKLKGQTSMALSYLAVNFATLWVMARLAFAFGFGAGSYIWVLVLSVIANFLQYTIWMKTEKSK